MTMFIWINWKYFRLWWWIYFNLWYSKHFFFNLIVILMWTKMGEIMIYDIDGYCLECLQMVSNIFEWSRSKLNTKSQRILFSVHTPFDPLFILLFSSTDYSCIWSASWREYEYYSSFSPSLSLTKSCRKEMTHKVKLGQ